MTAIQWTATALADLRDIETYIGRQSPRYARAVVERILDRVEILTQFPESGAVVPESGEEGLRELLERPYRVIYRASEREILVVAIIHAARNWP